MLKAQYQGSGELRLHYLLKRLFMTPFVNSEPMEPQIANVISIARQLNAINFPVSDQWLTGMIKVKLPLSWNTLKTILAHVKEGKQTSKGIIAQILAEEHHRIREDGGDAKAYYAKSLGKGKGKRGNKKEKRCSHCDRKGHDIADCRVLKQEQEEKVSKPTSRSSTPSSGKGASKHSSSKCSSSKTSASTKIADVDASDHSDLSSNGTVQVYMVRAVPTPPVSTTEQTVEQVYKTKAEL